MKARNRIKTLLLSLVVIAAVIAGVYSYGVWQVRHLNADVELPETPNGLLVSFELDSAATMRAQTGSPVFFDMGSRHSFASEGEVDILRAQGYPFREEGCLIVTTDPAGHYRLYTRKIILDLPFPNPELPGGYYVIPEVTLLVHKGQNIFGMDLLRRMVIERLWETNELRILTRVPDEYETVSPINVYDARMGGLFGRSLRASVDLVVNNEEPREYFFDTGGEMRAIELVQPFDKARHALSRVETDSLTGYPTQRRCMVRFGNRIRYSSVIYCDTLHTDEYSVNPLRLFDQDMVLDMPGHRLLIHKTRNAQ